MKNGYEKVFANLAATEAPTGLFGAIVTRIIAARRRALWARAALLSLAALLSASAVFGAVQYALQEISVSGFWEYFSLLSSDGNTALSHWKEFAFSITESFPTLGATLTLVTVLALLFFLSLTVRSIKRGGITQTQFA